MASDTEKKSEQVAVKLRPATLEEIENICEIEDRPVGYVVRELMIRGLNLYRTDRSLRDENSPYKIEDAVHEGLRRAIPEKGVKAAEVRLAPVVATISGKEKPVTKDDVRRMISDDELAEAKRRATPRKKRTG